jgi:carbonic anhydrase
VRKPSPATQGSDGLSTIEQASAGIDTALARNAVFAAGGEHEGATVFPTLGLVVITCMDPRVDPAHVLGFELGDAVVIRNTGGRVTSDVVAAVAFLGQIAEMVLPEGPLFEVAVIHHTQCGATALVDDGFRERYAERIGADESVLRDWAVVDPAATVARDVARLRSDDAISPRATVSGHVYDVVTGVVDTVVAAESPAAASGTAS